MLEGGPGVSGETFFATDFPPRNFFDWMEPIITGAGYRMMPRSLSIPYRVMYGVGTAMEALAWLLRPAYRFAPMVNRFAADYVCLDFTFTSEKARTRLGYVPRYTEAEAYERTIRYYREHSV